MNLATVAAEWQAAKAAEAEAVKFRRECEDRMLSLVGIPETLDGTENAEAGEYKIKIVGRMNRTIDGDKVQELAAESGLTDHLQSLFRWKPELNVSAWKNADESITKALSGAITVKPGRPSFTITKE